MSEPALALDQVVRTFAQGGDDRLEVLRGASLTVMPGEMVALVGPSGAGKSTLLHVAGLLEPPQSGEVLIEGAPCGGLDDTRRTRLRRSKLGFVYQFHHLLPEFTARENIVLPQMIAGVSKRDAGQRADELLESVGLSPRADHRPGKMSGGEQQRVAIVRALANDPAILLADEPTGELDDQTGKEVLELLNKVNQDLGTTILIVTHDPAIATSVQRAIAIKDGKTSTETTREVSYERKLNDETANTEEFLLIDTAGSVQIPRDVLNKLSIERKVRVDIKDGKVTLESGD